MAGVAVYQATIFCSTVILGHLEVLFPPYYRGALFAVAAVALAPSLLSIPTWCRGIKAIRYRPQWVDIIIALTVGTFLYTTWLEIKFDWTHGPQFFDSMSYHVPRALMWSWHGNFHPWRTAVWHQIGHPVGGSGSMLPLVLMGRGWLGGGWTGTVYAFGAAAALFVIARSLTFSMRSSLLSSLSLLACPVVGLRFSDITTDMGAAFPVLAGVAFLRTLPLSRGMFFFIALSGLGSACKQYVLFPVLMFSLVTFIPRWREILFDKKTLIGFFGGVITAAAACLLSLLPMYEAFGTFTGGPEAMSHSGFHYGISAVIRATKLVILNWLVEPLALLQLLERLKYLPDKTAEMISNSLGIAALYRDYLKSEVWYPVFTPFNNRSGLMPLIAVPWLILSVKRGWRWIVAALFILLSLSQISIFSENYWAARFMILNLSAFALLWGCRAEKNPFIVSLIIFCGMYASFRYIEPFRRELHGYSPNVEHMRAAANLVTPGEQIWLLTVGLANDAHWAGRIGTYRFEYVACPLDGDWIGLFARLKSGGRWFLLPTNGDVIKPGPSFETRMGPICPNDTVSNMKKYLSETGWRFKVSLPGLYELWTWVPESELIPQPAGA
jgi:hypothetical protein